MASLTAQVYLVSAKPDTLPNQLDPGKTVIVAIEFQKTWTRKGNFLHRLIAKPLRKRQVVANTIRFLDAARGKGYTIIQAPLVLDRHNRDEYRRMPFMPNLMGGFRKDTWNAEFEEGIVRPTDWIAQGRTGFDATVGSNLLPLITDNKYEHVHVLVCGF